MKTWFNRMSLNEIRVYLTLALLVLSVVALGELQKISGKDLFFLAFCVGLVIMDVRNCILKKIEASRKEASNK
jgi:hypothetical protein